MATVTIYKPGQIVPVSGIYAEVTASGQQIGERVTCVRGEPFPPTRYRGLGFVLVVRTN